MVTDTYVRHSFKSCEKWLKIHDLKVVWAFSRLVFFDLASACEPARSSTSISFKKNLGFVFSVNLVPRRSLQSVALRTLLPVPTYRRIEHFAKPPTFLFKFLKKEFKNIHLFIVYYLLIWVDYYAHSRSVCAICISEG